MATMCPLDGCRQTRGLCNHDKLMIAMVVVAVAAAIAHWGLGLF